MRVEIVDYGDRLTLKLGNTPCVPNKIKKVNFYKNRLARWRTSPRTWANIFYQVKPSMWAVPTGYNHEIQFSKDPPEFLSEIQHSSIFQKFQNISLHSKQFYHPFAIMSHYFYTFRFWKFIWIRFYTFFEIHTELIK